MRIRNLVLVALLAGLPARAADDPSKAGAYCPFPEPGETPVCLTDVEQKYPALIDGLAKGTLDESAAAQAEADFTSGSATQDAYLALSSLSYAYYRLAQIEASDPGADPALVARLQRWNDMLSTVYHDAAADPQLKSAVYEAASDLHARAPDVAGQCDDGVCDTTDRLMLALRSADDFTEQAGVRGALSRILGRMLGRNEDDAAR